MIRDDEILVREALHRSMEHVHPQPGLPARVHRRAAVLRRRRRAAAGGALLTVVILAGVAVSLPRTPATTLVVPPVGEAAPTGPVPSSSPAGKPPVNRLTTPTTSSSSGSTISAWGPPLLDDSFAGPLDPGVWTRYDGPSGSPATRWSPGEVSVRAGALRLAVDRAGAPASGVIAGGVKAGAPHRYGRWEIRWRMTAGPGVVGQFLFLGEGPAGIGNLATLDSAGNRLTVADLVHDTHHSVSLDGTRYHTLAVELTPRRVRWLLDGRALVSWAGAAPAEPVTAGLQALVQGSDCGAQPLPADCPGPAAFPQRLDVDRVRYQPYDK